MEDRQLAESGALRDVLAERQKQMEKGYTPEHDDEHSPWQIMRYGGLNWSPPLYGPINAARTRAAMVRMTACLLAAIELLDRGDYLDRRPCKGRNGNVCVAEGCYGEACLRTPPAGSEDDR